VSEWVEFNVPLDTHYVISETSLSRQSVALFPTVQVILGNLSNPTRQGLYGRFCSHMIDTLPVLISSVKAIKKKYWINVTKMHACKVVDCVYTLLCEGERLLEVTVRQPKRQTVPVESSVTFRCTGYSRVSCHQTFDITQICVSELGLLNQ